MILSIANEDLSSLRLYGNALDALELAGRSSP